MNKPLASILKDRISHFPFIDVLAGLVQTVEDFQPVDNAQSIRNRFPMSYDITLDANCYTGKERALIPDSSKKSIIYFEDFGSSIGRAGRNGDVEFTSNLRLVAWMNRARLVGDNYADVSGYAIPAIIGRLDLKFENIGIFKRLSIKASRLPQADAGLFSRYTYDETTRQYLMPPFEVFGIDFTCSSFVNAGCIAELDFSNPYNC